MKSNLSKIITTICPVAGWLFISTLLLSAGWTRAAETGVQAWVQHYNHAADADDRARKVVTDNAGNVIVAGYSDNGISGNDFLIIKYSSTGVPLWTNRYDGSAHESDKAQAVAVDSSGNVFVTGDSDGSGTGSDYVTIKYSGAGVALWTNRYNGPGNSEDTARAVAVDSSGNVFVTGTSTGSGGYSDYATVAYSGAGLPLWANRYNGPGNGYDVATAIVVDSSGDVFVTGGSDGSGTGSDYVTIKYSGAGVALWTNRYNGPANSTDSANAVAADGSGNVFVTGYSYGSDGYSDYATIKYSGAGVALWTNRYNGPGNGDDQATAVVADGSGDVFVTGYSASMNVNPLNYDYITIKYSSMGVPLWTNFYNGPGNNDDSPSAVAVDGSGNVFVTGYSRSGNYNTTADYATVAYSGAGVPLWTNFYNGPGNSDDAANAVAVDGSGNVFVTGHSWSGSSYDFATFKYSGAGVPLWTNRYNGLANGDDRATAVAVDESGNVVVAGYSWGNGGRNDYATIKYSSTGAPLWTNCYDGLSSNDDQATAVAIDGSGNVFVTGHSWSDSSSYDFATIKYSAAGVPLWTNRYNGPGNSYDYVTAVAVDGSGNVFVTGRTSPDFFLSSDYATVAYSGAGAPLWTNLYNGPGNGNDQATSIAVDGSGNVFVTGTSHSDDSLDDYATIKYSGMGVPLWTNRYHGPANFNDVANAIAVDAGGNVFVTGSSYGSGSGSDYLTIKYSSVGAPLWTNRYNGPGNSDDVATAVAVDGSGNVFVTGRSGTYPNYDYATVAYSGAGAPLWTNRYKVWNGNAQATAIAVDGSGNVYVTGYSANGNVFPYNLDYATIKYSNAGVPLWTNRYNGPANGDDQPQTKSCLAIGPDHAVFVTGVSDGNFTSSATYDFATIKYISVPLLAIERSTSDAIVSWPSEFSDFTLQESINFVTPSWSDIGQTPADDGTNRSVTVPAFMMGDRYFRLQK